MAVGVDLFLSGHLHRGHVGRTAERYPAGDRAALVIHAGTAVSTRQRGERNSFNLLSVEARRLTIVRFDWDPGGGAFIPVRPEERYVKGDGGWALE
jgi:hypothetical protein